MREYATRRGWRIALQVKEIGSGASQREKREQLLEAARRREIDVVLVWRLDRWGRSVTDLLATLQELEHLGVGFVSLTEALDLTTPAGRAMAGLLAVFAEFEREILRERVRAGLAHARQNGQRLAPEDACVSDMLVLIRWQGRMMAVPLSQLTALDLFAGPCKRTHAEADGRHSGQLCCGSAILLAYTSPGFVALAQYL
jgi:hypothetical protein